MNFKNIFRTLFSLILVICLVAPAIKVEAQDEVMVNMQKFGRLLRLIDGYYVDTANIDKLTEKAIIHMLSELDPHSTYISKEEVARMNEPLKGNFEGIGISFNIFNDTLLVTTTIAGGPSEKVGLRAGDRIVEVDGKNIASIGLKNTDVMDMLKGKKGTLVELKVIRKNIPDLLSFSIVRDKIPIYSLDASYMLDEATGFIKINRFSATTDDEFTEALTALKAQNMKNLVLDLRGNVGGYLQAAVNISDQFLSDDKMVVYMEGTNEPKKDYKATSAGLFEKGNLVILIDEGSASASEIVSGAIQDWDRGLILGRRSFGKGLVQKPYFLTDGSMVRLTIAHYYTPSGRCIQKPYENGVEEYRHDYQKRLTSGEMFSADSIVFADSLKYKTLKTGRTVFGGGGVLPDIFVPMDTSHYYRYYNRLRNTVLYNFVVDYVDKNRADLKKNYTDFDKFNTNFQVSQEMIDAIVAKGEKEKIEKDEESLAFTLDKMKKEIKALIARDIFSRNDFFKIFYEDDDEIIRALEIIKNQTEYNNMLVSNE